MDASGDVHVVDRHMEAIDKRVEALLDEKCQSPPDEQLASLVHSLGKAFPSTNDALPKARDLSLTAKSGADKLEAILENVNSLYDTFVRQRHSARLEAVKVLEDKLENVPAAKEKKAKKARKKLNKFASDVAPRLEKDTQGWKSCSTVSWLTEAITALRCLQTWLQSLHRRWTRPKFYCALKQWVAVRTTHISWSTCSKRIHVAKTANESLGYSIDLCHTAALQAEFRSAFSVVQRSCSLPATALLILLKSRSEAPTSVATLGSCLSALASLRAAHNTRQRCSPSEIVEQHLPPRLCSVLSTLREQAVEFKMSAIPPRSAVRELVWCLEDFHSKRHQVLRADATDLNAKVAEHRAAQLRVQELGKPFWEYLKMLSAPRANRDKQHGCHSTGQLLASRPGTIIAKFFRSLNERLWLLLTDVSRALEKACDDTKETIVASHKQAPRDTSEARQSFLAGGTPTPLPSPSTSPDQTLQAAEPCVRIIDDWAAQCCRIVNKSIDAREVAVGDLVRVLDSCTSFCQESSHADVDPLQDKLEVAFAALADAVAEEESARNEHFEHTFPLNELRRNLTNLLISIRQFRDDIRAILQLLKPLQEFLRDCDMVAELSVVDRAIALHKSFSKEHREVRKALLQAKHDVEMATVEDIKADQLARLKERRRACAKSLRRLLHRHEHDVQALVRLAELHAPEILARLPRDTPQDALRPLVEHFHSDGLRNRNISVEDFEDLQPLQSTHSRHPMFVGNWQGLKYILKEFAAADKTILKEARTLRSLKHPNIVEVVHLIHSAALNKEYLQMPFYNGGSLQDAISRLPQWTMADVTHIMRQVMIGLAHIHRNGVVHRDIKPANILLSYDNLANQAGTRIHVRIADFDVSKNIVLPGQTSLMTTSTVVRGYTPGFVAPEVEPPQNQPATDKSDIYSAGLVLFDVLFHDNTRARECRPTTLRPFSRGKLKNVAQGISAPVLDVLSAMLEYKPANRPSAAEVLARPFFLHSEVELKEKLHKSALESRSAQQKQQEAMAQHKAKALQALNALEARLDEEKADAQSKAQQIAELKNRQAAEYAAYQEQIDAQRREEAARVARLQTHMQSMQAEHVERETALTHTIDDFEAKEAKRLGRKYTCELCFEDTFALHGVLCPRQQHFLCDECFDSWVAAQSDKTQQNKLKDRQGQVYCVHYTSKDNECNGIQEQKCFSDSNVATHTTRETFQAYMTSKQELVEARLSLLKDVEVKEQVARKLEELMQLDEHQRQVRAARDHIIEEILTTRCPCCRGAFIDFSGCFAITCHCGGHFCAWCLADCGADAHPHVRTCHLSLNGGGYFGSEAQFSQSNTRRARTRLGQYVATLGDLAQEVLQSLAMELRDLGLGDMVP